MKMHSPSELDNVVQMVLNNVDQPSEDGTCHYLDLKAIQVAKYADMNHCYSM